MGKTCSVGFKRRGRLAYQGMPFCWLVNVDRPLSSWSFQSWLARLEWGTKSASPHLFWSGNYIVGSHRRWFRNASIPTQGSAIVWDNNVFYKTCGLVKTLLELWLAREVVVGVWVFHILTLLNQRQRWAWRRCERRTLPHSYLPPSLVRSAKVKSPLPTPGLSWWSLSDPCLNSFVPLIGHPYLIWKRPCKKLAYTLEYWILI